MKRMYRRGKVKKALAAVAFCVALSVGTICSADEGKVTVDAKIRASADASSEQVGSAKQGGTVDVISQTTGTDGKNWYQVWVNGEDKGYIRADLVEVPEGSIPMRNDTTANVSTASQPADTTATPTEARRATVSTNGARIRKGATTSHDVVATANRGMVLTVIGEAAGTDGKTWYQVSFTYNDREITGFIRSDLVSFEEVPPDEATANITGTENEGEAETPKDETPQETPDEGAQGAELIQSPIPIDSDNEPYIMPGFLETKVNDANDVAHKGWSNGSFFICYLRMPNGDEDWYLVDNSDPANKIYQRYVYADKNSTVPSDSALSGSILPIAVLAVIIVILIAVIGLMFLRLREYSGGYDDDDEYGDDDDDIEDLEEEDDDDDFTPPPSRRAAPNGRPIQGQPQRRPQPPQGQPQRRPQPPQGQPQRRPQPPQGQPQRRPQPEGDVRRRPEGDGRVVTKNNNARPAGGQAPNRRPAQGQPQQRTNTKNNIGNEQDDMDFIDI